MTVNNEAAGNRTDTLNSNICNRSTEKNEILLVLIYLLFILVFKKNQKNNQNILIQ